MGYIYSGTLSSFFCSPKVNKEKVAKSIAYKYKKQMDWMRNKEDSRRRRRTRSGNVYIRQDSLQWTQ